MVYNARKTNAMITSYKAHVFMLLGYNFLNIIMYSERIL